MRSGEANKLEERYAELGRKIKHEAETAANAHKPKMTESTTMLEQAKGGVVAEVAATHHLIEETNAAAAETEQAEGRLVVESTATRNLGEDANAAAASNLGEDANITAAENLDQQQHTVQVKMQTQQQHKEKQR